MKSFLLSLMIVSTVGCGVAQELTGHCNGFMDAYCDAILGQDPVTQDDVDLINQRIANLQAQVDTLNAQVTQGSQYMTSVNNLILTLGSQITSLTASITQIQVQVQANGQQDAQQQQAIQVLQTSVNSLTSQVNVLSQGQTQQQIVLNSIIARLLSLESHDAVVAFIDPCGDGPGYDEVLLKTQNGNLVAYFESGSNRFLSIIGPGSYQTTDQQACRFSVSNDGSINY